LVVQTSFLGDVILTTPLLSELATRGPVDVLVTKAAAPLLAHHPAVRDVLVFDKRGGDRGVGGIRRMAQRLARREDGSPRHLHTAYFAQMSLRSALVPWLARIPVRIGWAASRPGRVFYTRRVAYAKDAHHAARCWALAFPDGVPAGAAMPMPTLYPGPAEHAAVDALLGVPVDGAGRGRGSDAPSSTQPLVVLSPGSVWGTKRWPYYAPLAAALASDARVVVLGGPGEQPLAQEILAAAPQAVDATGRLSLLASAEVVRRAAVLVTNDSAPLHMASAVGTPAVAIFGPTVPAFGFGPLGPESVVVEHDAMPCRPCHHHGPPTCPLTHFRCMKELGVERVLGEVQRVLARRG
jgi:heptosyltransferase-2